MIIPKIEQPVSVPKWTLHRFLSNDLCTVGLLVLDGLSFLTMERPWKNNEPFVSCIPKGVYALEKGMYNRGGYETFVVLNVPDRTKIKIHRGNKASNVNGCIALGNRLGSLGGETAVLNSGVAFNAFWKAVKDIDGPVFLDIRESSLTADGLRRAFMEV